MSPDTPVTHVDQQQQQPATVKVGSSKPSQGPVGRKDNSGATRVDATKTLRRDASPSLSLEEDSFLHPAEDEWRSTRRRSSATSDICRVLPTPPHSPRAAYGMGASGGSRGTASLESSASLSVDDAYRRQSSINDAETIKIVIHDVETDQSRIMKSQDTGRRRVTVHRDMSDINNRSRGLGMRVVGGKPAEDGRLVAYVVWIVPTGPADNAGVYQGDKVGILKSQDTGRRRVTVHRDMSDINNRSRGLGMRVVGGKPAEDGRLVAYVVWIVPTGPADNAGVYQGDKVLEWNGVSLIDRSFEEVCSIIEQTTTLDVIDMVLESSGEVSVSTVRTILTFGIIVGTILISITTVKTTFTSIITVRTTLTSIITVRTTLISIITVRTTLSPIINVRTTLSPIITVRTTLSPIITVRTTLSPIITVRSTLGY
ncbi:PDZ domain [Trinorchestia longiramus]|nr:PDZ domain [Trinorchestia longiramus]